MTQQLRTVVEAVAARNPGAHSICMGLLTQPDGGLLIGLLHEQGITGSEVWLLFKNCCQEELTQFRASILQGTAQELLGRVPDSTFYRVSTEKTP